MDARRADAVRPTRAIGVASAAAAGMFVIGLPYFAGTPIPGASLLTDSLADPAVARALGLPETGA